MLREVSDEDVLKFQNPWCLFEYDYRIDETCEWPETRNCPYASGKSNWQTSEKEGQT